MKPTIADAFTAAAQAFNVPPAFMRSRDRTYETAHARFAAWLICRDLLGHSFPMIAKHTGHDHTSVMHGVRRARSLYRACHDFAERYDAAHDQANAAANRKIVFRTRRLQKAPCAASQPVPE